MNVLLVALNATYSHTNLAVRYLREYCEPQFPNIETLEYNINQSTETILADIVQRQPDVVGFSCYIWNIELILPLINNLRKVCPETTIIAGGPEVSFDTQYWLDKYPALDFIIGGEGEEALRKFLEQRQQNQGQFTKEQLSSVPGLVYRYNGEVIENPWYVMDLAEVPPIYMGDLTELTNKIVYYETTRGCPFKCAYCLSSVMGRVRKFPMERSKEELRRLAALGVEQVRFVDRTFNYDAKRAYELIEFMISLDTPTRFQLEVSGDILTEPVLELLKTAPENRFQFEIGVQSTFEPTLEAVSRRTDLERLREVVKFLKEETTVRVLLDLIAGLPEEGFWRFGESFDYVYSLQPDRIHLGFLKLLRGSQLREEATDFGCVYTDEAPYEVLYTKDLTYGEIQRLKVIEDLVERFAPPRFDKAFEYLLRDGKSPFALFNELAEKWEAKGYHWYNHSLFTLYKMLFELLGPENPDLLPWLRYDFRKSEPRRATPLWMGGRSDRALENELIRTGEVFQFLPELRDLRPRDIGRRIFVEELKFAKGTERLLFYFADGSDLAEVYQL